MGFFKDLKQDLSQAVNELTEDAAKITSDESESVQETVPDDDVMVDTLNEEPEDAAEDIDVSKMLENVDTNEEAVTEEPKAEESETAGPFKEPEKKKTKKNTKEPVVEPVKEDEQEETDETTIISRGLRIKGDIESSGSIELLGSVEGNVSCSGKLVASGNITGNTNSKEFYSDNAKITGDINCEGPVKIGNGSVIIGNLYAHSAVIAGAIKGDIDVHGPVIIDATAIVMGDIKSESFQINRGAVLEGYISQCYSDNSPKKFLVINKRGFDYERKRILLKLSGEALAGDKKTGFDESTVLEIAAQVKKIHDLGAQVGVVIGGGNFWRGRSSENMDRTKADQIGMLATVMNCIYVSEMFRSTGMKTAILTPFMCGSVTELFSKDLANRYFEDGTVVFLQAEQDILIFLQIQELYYVQLKWMRMQFILPKPLTVYMTVILRLILQLRNMMRFQ